MNKSEYISTNINNFDILKLPSKCESLIQISIAHSGS